MKKLLQGLKCGSIMVNSWNLLMCFLLLSYNIGVNARNFDYNVKHQRKRNVVEPPSCDSVKHFFESMNVTIVSQLSSGDNRNGKICGGSCCSAATEDELIGKASNNFDRLLRHHTRNLRSNLEATTKTFRNHVLELSYQSENNTLSIFSQVYERMAPLSKQLISRLYTKIRNHFTTKQDPEFSQSVQRFFIELFPVAYHHAVHMASANAGDFHIDYKNCLMHTFDDLQPFGNIPKTLAKQLHQSIETASAFLIGLERAADILASIEELDTNSLTPNCQKHLMKMNYCAQCSGFNRHHTKPCNGYCLNVMRGCLADYVGVIDSPWTNVAEALEKLWHHSIKTEHGIEEAIKDLSVKLSEAIMYAMDNGPKVEAKVKKACGTPNLLPIDKTLTPIEDSHEFVPPKKIGSLFQMEMLHHLVQLNKSKDFYARIIDNACAGAEYKNDDHHCWTGEKIGQYTQKVMSTGADAQRYNPEVPSLDVNSFTRSNKLSELVDKLIKLRHTIASAESQYLPVALHSDVQGDMARHEEEGSGNFRDEGDDEEYVGGSGDGSGDGPIDHLLPKVNSPDTSVPDGAPSISQYSISMLLSVLLSMAVCLVDRML